MRKEYIYRYIPLAALFSTLGLIFPVFFHLIGLGSTFLPMFLPVIMGSLLLPPSMAVTVAIITPVISFLLTGMPPAYPPFLLLVLLELIVVSFLSSYLFYIRTFSVWITLLVALSIDRILLFLFIWVLAPYLGFPEKFYSVGALLYGIPGVILIFIVIPATIKLMRQKYPQILVHDNNGSNP